MMEAKKNIATDRYVIINDGQFIYPVMRKELLDGDSEEKLSNMTSDEYSEWCNKVPCVDYANIGTEIMIRRCHRLISHGCDIWNIDIPVERK